MNRYPRTPPSQGAWDSYGWNAPPDDIATSELWDREIGRDVGREAYEQNLRAKGLLVKQSDQIVERLERCGINGSYGRPISMVGLVTGIAERETDYRNCNMIPAVQSRNVNDMMKHLRYLMDCVPKRELRMLVISGGWVPLQDYRQHHEAHCRRLSRLAADPIIRSSGIEMVFYNVENTIQRTDDGVAMLNLHSHALIRCRRYLGKVRWAEMMDRFRKASPKGYVHDSPILKPAEVVKYSFKPSEFDQLSDDEFSELFHQISGGREKRDPETGEMVTRSTRLVTVSDDPSELTMWRDPDPIPVMEGPLRFFHPLGEMRQFRAKLRENGQKLLMVPTRDNRMVWRLTQKKDRQPREDTRSKSTGDVVVAITRPMARFDMRKEPCVIVEGYGGDFGRMVRTNDLQEFVARARAIHADRVRSGEAPASELPRGSEGHPAGAVPLYAAHNSDNCPSAGWEHGGAPPDRQAYPPPPAFPEVAH